MAARVHRNAYMESQPHQFLPAVLDELKLPGAIKKGARAISAIKGVEVTSDPKGTNIQPSVFGIDAIPRKLATNSR